ncbi:MAG TPA: hypothetical protein VK614_13525 [Allosphingosinicella sp.]|nr:hypothetical protein [Allosphingosinicella sp.]
MRPTLKILLLLLLTLPAAAMAQGAPRALDVPADAAWRHVRTGLILPPTVDGLTRTEIRDLGSDELDIVASYEDRDEDEPVWVTVYLYETGVPDVPLWFDRALTAIMERLDNGLIGTAAPAPTAFARPGAANASGLRAAVDLFRPSAGTTALAIAPLGPFQLKIRISGPWLGHTALDARLTRFIAGLRWPAETAPPAPAAVPIAPCPAPLQLRNARRLRTETEDALMGALMGVDLATDEAGNRPPPPVYCREPGATTAHGVYRANAATDAYLIALNDAGIAYSVGEQLDLGALTGEGRRGRRFALVLLDRETTGVVANFNRLPPPEQALAVAQRSAPSILVSNHPPAGN